jgi:membrane dipeptidase
VAAAADFERAKTLGAIGIMIGQQNSEHFRTVGDVDRFYSLGQRVSQLTYRGNRIGGGSSDPTDRGLSEYGAAIVERMNQVGMAVDISHCGDRTSLDAIEASRRPVLVTESVSHWFDQCDSKRFDRPGSKILSKWLDDSSKGRM